MERGNTKHGPAQDEELKHEAQPIVQGHGPSHVEEWRQTEPMPDDTDDPEVTTAAGMDGEERDAGAPAYSASPGDAGDLSRADEIIYSTGVDDENDGSDDTDPEAPEGER